MEYFTSVAAIAIALAGFTGLVTAFGRNEGVLRDSDTLRIRVLLYLTFSTMFFALLPEALMMSAKTSGVAWEVAAVGWSVSVILFLGYMVTSMRHIRPEFPIITAMFFIFGAMYHVYALYAVWVIGESRLVLAVGLLWGLTYGGVVFYAALTSVWKAGDT